MAETKRLHFVGVGGVGMSGIAHVASDLGYVVSGSDMKASRYTEQLEQAGITVHIGHDAANVHDDCDIVVVSTAIPETNPEVVRARELGDALDSQEFADKVIALATDAALREEMRADAAAFKTEDAAHALADVVCRFARA